MGSDISAAILPVNSGAHGAGRGPVLASLIMSSKRAKPTAADKAAAARLKAAWDARDPKMGLTQDKMAEQLGITQGAVSQYLNGLIPLNFRTLQGFAAALGIDPLTIRSDLPEQRHLASGVEAWAEVTGYSQPAALGDGSLPDDYAEAHKLKFRASSLRRKGLNPAHLHVYYGDGDSMEPRIHDGDAILFDTSDTRIVDNRIYVIRYEGHVYAKRLQVHEDLVLIESDNRTDPKWARPVLVKPGDDFEVIGRVRWIGSWEG